jgi:RNA polymerase sigma-70 factor (sigma-E family)
VAITVSSPAAVPVAADDRDQRIRVLFDEHYPGLCRLAYLIVGDAALAEELVMDSFMRTFAGWRRIRDLERADAYLRRTVVNLSRSRLRRQRTADRPVVAAPAPTSSWDADTHEEARLIWDAVRALPDRQRAAVVLRYYEDLSEADVAHALNCSAGTVKSQLSKARASLARALGEQGAQE